MKFNLRLAISPCPNDTFIAYGLLHNKIRNENFKVEVQFLDIEQLNNLALKNQADIIKVSTAIIPAISRNYKILNSGAALGNNCGPLLIAKTNSFVQKSDTKVAIPGYHTTAFNLFKRYFGSDFIVKPMIFCDIEDAILQNQIDAGVIIHENRFTFREKGLHEICDLGEKWHSETSLPIPLGCIAVSKKIDSQLAHEIDVAFHESVKYALNHPNEVMKFVREYSQTMRDEVAQKHIDLYVNSETVLLSDIGKQAIINFIDKTECENNCTFDKQNLFV